MQAKQNRSDPRLSCETRFVSESAQRIWCVIQLNIHRHRTSTLHGPIKIKAKNIQKERTSASSCPSTATRRLCTTERYLKAEKTFRGENEIQSKAVTEEHLIDVAKQILQPPPTPPAEVGRLEFWHLIPATYLRLAKLQNKFMIHWPRKPHSHRR